MIEYHTDTAIRIGDLINHNLIDSDLSFFDTREGSTQMDLVRKTLTDDEG